MFTIMKQHRIFQIIGLLFIFISCVEPYEAETEIFEDVLVVEAMITNEIKHQEITLSRSYRFENDSIAFEKNATVKVIENNNITFEFFEENHGKYVSKIPFNAKSGQCAVCKGQGFTKVVLDFISDIESVCDICHGKRYQPQILEVKFKDLDISDVLNLNINEACSFFSEPFHAGFSVRRVSHVFQKSSQLGHGLWRYLMFYPTGIHFSNGLVNTKKNKKV